MASSTLNITLPKPFVAYIEAKVESGAYGNPSDYVRELIRRERDHQLAELEDHLELAMQGEAFDISEEDLQGSNLVEVLRSRLRARA
jgi:antitoxin ParD1/3/4